MEKNKQDTQNRWSDARELFPGVSEKVRFDPKTGRFENIIYSKRGGKHFHGYIDPSTNEAGGEINKNK